MKRGSNIRQGLMMAAVAAFCLPGAACRPDARQQRIDAWLLCIECAQHELDSVVVMRDRAVDDLASALKGPTPAMRANMRQQLAGSYRRIVEYAVANPQDSVPQVGEAEYVGELLSNFEAVYEKRAAFALGRIRIPRAMDALRQAVRDSLRYRTDVRAVVRAAVGADPGTAGTLTGVVTDSLTGARLSGVQVYLDGTPVGAVTNGNGRYIISHIPPGLYALAARRIGYQDRRDSVSLGAAQTVVVDLALTPSVASVTVTPAADTISVGGTTQLAATLRDAAGNVLTGPVVTWSSSNPAVAPVSGAGLVTGVAVGTATITATYVGDPTKKASAQVTVSA